jgi:trimethylamine corrinoid protein
MDIYQRLYEAVLEGDTEKAVSAAREVVEKRIDMREALERGLLLGLREVGERFGRLEYFLADMLLSAEAMKAAMSILAPEMERQKVEIAQKGRIVIGTVRGDIHEIGKNIVATVLKAHGYEVYDVGLDCDPLLFIKKAEEVGATIIGASSLMSTTMPAQKELIEVMKSMGVRDRYKVIVGGAPVTREWASEIGADGWGENAPETVRLVERLLEG